MTIPNTHSRTLFMIALLLFSWSANAQKSDTSKTFSVTIEQNGHPLEIKEHTVVLDPGSFDIVFDLSEPMGVLVNASTRNESYKAAKTGKALKEIRGFQETGMAETLFNEDRELWIADDAPSYWFYSSDDEHRFNEVSKSGDHYIVRRTIEQFYDVASGERIDLFQSGAPLYLVFMSSKKGATVMDQIEVQRAFLLLKWNE